MSRLDKELSRLYVYASMLSDQDTRVSEPQGMQQEMQQLYANFAAQAAFIEPEVLRVGSAKVESFLTAEPRLKPYEFYLRDIVRRAAHTLTDPEEKLLADAGPLAGSASNIYTILANADFPYPTITLADGKTAKVDQAGYSALRISPKREDRKAAMGAFFGALGGFGRTFGTTMNTQVQKSLFYARARKYGSNLEAALNGPNIPVPVYMRLIEGVNKSLPTFHRYLKLRKRMMGLKDDLHYYDLYAPLVAEVDLKYTPEQGQALVVSSMAPLGSDYTGVLQRAFKERWLDWYPTEGKVSGAYSNGGAYDVHPYMLLNYQGEYNDVSTLTHELGHTMHSFYSNKRQPYATASYATFVAEVASTFNEALLVDHVLKQIKDTPTRLSILGNYLEGIKSTVFRQTQFAEFELKMHEMAQAGQPITGDALAKLYLDITRRYYGHDRGRVRGGRLHRPRVELHPALLPRLLRVPVRHVVHRGRGAVVQGAVGRHEGARRLPDVPGLGRVEVSDRSAEGRRRGHDHRRAAGSDDQADERGDGRDREAAAEAVGVPVFGLSALRL